MSTHYFIIWVLLLVCIGLMGWVIVLDSKVDHLRSIMRPRGELTAAEALYGFAGWLTTFETPITASAKHDAGVWATLVDRFNTKQGFAEPRGNWDEYLIPMERDK